MAEAGTRIRLEIVTPEKLAFDQTVDSVTAPGLLGEFGVLPHHRPMLAATKSGVVRCSSGGVETVLVVGPGFAEVEPDHVILLTDKCEMARDIDHEQAVKDFTGIDAQYKSFKGDCDTAEFQEIERKVAWAEACVSVSRH